MCVGDKNSGFSLEGKMEFRRVEGPSLAPWLCAQPVVPDSVCFLSLFKFYINYDCLGSGI